LAYFRAIDNVLVIWYIKFVYTTLDKFMPFSAHSQENKQEMIRLSISEAAKLFGVSTQTIRRALKNNQITYAVVGDRYKLNFESLIKWSQETTTVRNKLAKYGIGQYVSQWRIRNKLYSPNQKFVKNVREQ
jgi:excisionase family DNA binding protein